MSIDANKQLKVKSTFPLANMPDNYMRNALGKLKAWLKTYKQNRQDQKAIKNLLDLSDKNLRDIGINRNDVIWASKLPHDKIATLELQRIARGTCKYFS